jgi:hypothetical protein
MRPNQWVALSQWPRSLLYFRIGNTERLCFSQRFLPSLVDRLSKTRQHNPFAPSALHRFHHYYGLFRPRASHRYSHACGTSTRVSPLTSRRQFPGSAQKPGSSSCHLYAGRRPDNKQAPSGLILELSEYPSFDAIADISTPHQWFALAHLLDPYLTPSTGTFSLTLTTPALYQRSLRRFETSSCKPVPRGQPSSFAQLRTLYILKVRSWHTQTYRRFCDHVILWGFHKISQGQALSLFRGKSLPRSQTLLSKLHGCQPITLVSAGSHSSFDKKMTSS